MKKVIGIIVCISMLLVPIGLEAKEGDSIDVVLSFNLTVEDKFTYEVKVSEGGSLYDGSQRVTNGIMEYQLSVGQEKTFKICPDIGYEVKWIRHNGETGSIGREITIKGVSGNSVLEVKYGRIHEEPNTPNIPNEPDTPDRPSNPDTPSTPGKPSIPNRPIGPNVPILPSVPNIPNIPEWVEQPSISGVVEIPNQSTNIDRPEVGTNKDNPVGTISPSELTEIVVKEDETPTGIRVLSQGKEKLYSYLFVVLIVSILYLVIVKRRKKEDEETY